ncbi:MAG: hypothetical protein KAH23_06775 [Kiritimatiellae bacterium]|nr:hypothetical protein [Kiritimatiellia bacterium]
MNKTDNNRMNRYEFIRSCGRNGALGLLGLLSACLVKRRRGIDRSAHRCINRSVCCDCSSFDRCGLPAALSAKKQRGEAPAAPRTDDGED